MEDVRGFLGRVEMGRQMILRSQEFRIWKSLQCPTKAYDGPSQCTRRRGWEGPPTLSSEHSYMHKPLRGKPPWGKQRDLSFGLKQGLATHLSAQGFPTSPTCRSAWCLRESTCLVTCAHSHRLMCRSLRSLFKHGRTKLLGRFLPWGGRTKMEAKGLAKFQLLLSQWCSWESWWHCYLAKGSRGHQLPVPAQCLLLGS